MVDAQVGGHPHRSRTLAEAGHHIGAGFRSGQYDVTRYRLPAMAKAFEASNGPLGRNVISCPRSSPGRRRDTAHAISRPAVVMVR